MTKILRVRLKNSVNRSYDIHIRPGLFNELPRYIGQRRKSGHVFIITDSNVRRLYGDRLCRLLYAGGIDSWLIDFEAGEKSKNASTIYALQTQLLEHGVRRDSLIVALGGGVVGDVAGFVAATVLRGVQYIQVPTTLLAQVDSSVGGKVGIDHPHGKNLIGAFHQPAAVYIDPRVLATLPAAEFRNGLAEVVKIAAAFDRKMFERIERSVSRIKKDHPRVLSTFIALSVGLKASVVQRDEFDSGLRKALNLGHTLGHALEAATGYRMKHGVAVALGLAAESHIAVRMGLLRPREYGRVITVLRALRLPTRFPRIDTRTKFLAALYADKKGEAGVTKFVLLRGIGRCAIGVEVPSPFVFELLSQ